MSLALLLLLGGRNHPSTKMSTLLSLGIMVALAFSVVVVSMVNLGFSKKITESVDDITQYPTHYVYRDVRLGDPAGRPTQDQRSSFAAAVHRELARAHLDKSPDVQSYTYAPSLLLAEEEAKKVLASDLSEKAILAIANVAAAATIAGQTNRRLDYITLCVAPSSAGPQGKNEMWARDSEEVLGKSWVIVLGSARSVGAAAKTVPIKTLTVTAHAPEKWNKICTMWISQNLAHVMDRRGDLYLGLAWEQDKVPAMEKVSKLLTASDNKLVVQETYKKFLLRTLASNDQLRNVQIMLSGLVIGVMGFVGIYQLSALLMMIGLHARRDVSQLRAMGFSSLRVLGVFLWVGGLLCGTGLTIGSVLAWFWLPHMNDHVLAVMTAINAQDFADTLPFERSLPFILKAWAVGLSVSIVISICPAWISSRTLPSDVWREES